MPAVEPNHLRDLVGQLRKIADGLTRLFPQEEKFAATGRATALRKAADVLEGLPCEHDPVAEATEKTRAVCRWCQRSMVRRWVAETDAEAYEAGTAEPGHERATTGNLWPSEEWVGK